MSMLSFIFAIVLNITSLSAVGPYSVGQYAQGGVVFWVDPSGDHGLVAAIEDQDGGAGLPWSNGSYITTNAYLQGLYLGTVNTNTICTAQGDGAYAAKAASSYSVTIDGITYADWYLPCNTELSLMFQTASTINTTAIANGGVAFAQEMYWNSNENSYDFAHNQDFVTGGMNNDDKTYSLRVRAIRSF